MSPETLDAIVNVAFAIGGGLGAVVVAIAVAAWKIRGWIDGLVKRLDKLTERVAKAEKGNEETMAALKAHDDTCVERAASTTEALAKGDERMAGMERQLERGTAKIDRMDDGQRELMSKVDRLIGFYTRDFADADDRPKAGV